jgi:hypothetical protein
VADQTHSCPGRCGVQVQRHMLACKPCWARLPGHLRATVTGAYRTHRSDPGRHREAVRAALLWYGDNPTLGAGRG